jgi:hypothetical protein
MIIWRGAGVLVLFIVFVVSLCGQLLSNMLAGEKYWNTQSWPFACVLIVAGGVIWLTDWNLARYPKRVFIDEQTKERVEVGGAHDFFFIRMKWWGLLSAALGVAFWLAGMTPGDK